MMVKNECVAAFYYVTIFFSRISKCYSTLNSHSKIVFYEYLLKSSEYKSRLSFYPCHFAFRLYVFFLFSIFFVFSSVQTQGMYLRRWYRNRPKQWQWKQRQHHDDWKRVFEKLKCEQYISQQLIVWLHEQHILSISHIWFQTEQNLFLVLSFC